MKGLIIVVLFMFAAVFIPACNGEGESAKETARQYNGKGVVLGVDQEEGIVTIDHGEIKGLMSAMTMDFKVNDKKILESLQNGDVVEFTIVKSSEDLWVNAIKKTGKRQVTGAEIYKERCAKCHGDKGEGKRKGIPLIEGHALSHTEEDFLKQVREGGEKMPSFSDKLSEKEIATVVKYVREEIQNGLRKDTGHEH